MRACVLVCLALLCLPLAARGQNGTGILLEPSLVLRAAPPRQLTLNANVPQFLYQPGGDSIAYVSVHDDNGTRTTAVKFVGAHQKDPDTHTLYTVTGDAPDADPPVLSPHVPDLTLLGWSSNGRYLMFEQGHLPDVSEQCFCVDIGSASFRATPVPMPPGVGATLSAWSPSCRRFLIVVQDSRPDANGLSPVTTAELYDPARDQVQPVTIPDGLRVKGWLDDDHLLLTQRTGTGVATVTSSLSYDITAGTQQQIAKPSPLSLPYGSLFFETAPLQTTPKLPGISLENQPHTLKDAQGVAQTKAQTVWLRKAKAPKALSTLPIGVTPGEYDPQAQWSPDGDGVAFVAHGDLFVVGLTEQEASPFEKLAAGETLTCKEEKMVIGENLRQIGLGILEYTQDYDEKFPSADGWHDAVFPYIKDESVFNFPGVPITYHMPPGKTLASLDAPASEPLATADTPCAHIVLYADGHVKSFDKAGADAPAPP